MHRELFRISYEDIVSLENLLEAWQEFVKGKRSRQDVQIFEHSLMDNLFTLHEDLINCSYEHAPYSSFVITDPKTRQIHKATVADRIVHRSLYRKFYPFFDSKFIADSYSCRIEKGTHKALDRFTIFLRKVTKNYQKTGWALKCDIQKFFASVDQQILLDILGPHIVDKRITCLIRKILYSFQVSGTKGLPLGNLTSQLFSNVYLNVFDQFVKHTLRAKYYIRYADDFVLFSHSQQYLARLLPVLQDFLWKELQLKMHPFKIEMRTIASGVDFLGWVHFPHHRVLRMSTKRRMIAKCSEKNIDSYFGLLKHGNSKKLVDSIDQNLVVS